MAAFTTLWGQSWVGASESRRQVAPKSKIFGLKPFTGKVCWVLFWSTVERSALETAMWSSQQPRAQMKSTVGVVSEKKGGRIRALRQTLLRVLFVLRVAPLPFKFFLSFFFGNFFLAVLFVWVCICVCVVGASALENVLSKVTCISSVTYPVGNLWP